MYTVTSGPTVIGHAKRLAWSPEPDHVFLQFLPTPAFAALKPRIDAMVSAAMADSTGHPYDAYPELVDLDLKLRDETGLIVSSGIIAFLEGSGGLKSAPDDELRLLGIEPTSPLLFLSTTFGGSLEDWEPERHKGKTPQPHARRPKPAKKSAKKRAAKRTKPRAKRAAIRYSPRVKSRKKRRP